MRVPAPVYVMLGVGLTLGATVPGSASAQVPTVESQPRVAAPARGAVIQTAAPADAATPAAQPASQPAAAPAAAEPTPVTAVTAPPPGVTTVPAPSPATASSSQAATAATRSYTASNSALKLDGLLVPTVKSVEGGAITADIAALQLGTGILPKKQVTSLKYEDITFYAGLESKSLIEWITASWKGSPQRKQGSILGLDFNNTVRNERPFRDALITETTIPTLDVGSKDAAYLSVKIAPEEIIDTKGSGEKAQPSVGHQKWAVSNFRFEMAEIDGGGVSRIESFTVRQPVANDEIGAQRISTKAPGKIEFPNLKIFFAESAAKAWGDWFDDFLLKGNNGDDKERNGAIVFLDQLRANELGRVNLFNCGIFRLAPESQGGKAVSTIGQMRADLYCERMELVAAPGK